MFFRSMRLGVPVVGAGLAVQLLTVSMLAMFAAGNGAHWAMASMFAAVAVGAGVAVVCFCRRPFLDRTVLIRRCPVCDVLLYRESRYCPDCGSCIATGRS